LPDEIWLTKLELSRTEEESRVRNLREKILNLYQVDLDTASAEDIIINEEARVEIEDLRRKLQAIGPVNLMALEENKELEDRFTLLKREREDIIRAQEELRQVIVKINQTSRQMFTETLEKIREEFHRMFRLLFTGGKADLILQEGDALESGIEIVARPPGKNLSTISQLSGGEKALTAIALLFALFKIRPSPFCVLDEIDAPLDESNIERFASLLKEFLKTTQFIIITHNKKTISLGQVIYGITMEEPGLSKIISVKFTSPHAPAPSPVAVS
jgi:chromosome segregation protein